MAKAQRIPKHKAMSFNRSLHPISGGLPINRANWSVQSQRSYCPDDAYHDAPYRCRVCRADCVFTAAEQKHAYEVEKRYIDQRRVYCQSCYQRLNHVLDALAKAQQQWAENKRQLANDADFLTQWLALITELGAFRVRTDTMLKQMLIKQLEKINSLGDK